MTDPSTATASSAPAGGVLDAVGRRVSAGAGALLGRAFGVAAHLRGTKPLHPTGRVGSAVLQVTSPRPDLGVPWLASAGSLQGLVRWSRAAGLTPPLPDVEGFALRLEEPAGDLLFASTGTGALSRSLLTLRLHRHHGAQSTLLPVATAAGPLRLKVEPTSGGEEPPTVFDLAVALGRSRWDSVGVISVHGWGPDQPIRFDPVANTPAGMTQYPWIARLRRPAYSWARRSAPARPDTEPELEQARP